MDRLTIRTSYTGAALGSFMEESRRNEWVCGNQATECLDLTCVILGELVSKFGMTTGARSDKNEQNRGKKAILSGPCATVHEERPSGGQAIQHSLHDSIVDKGYKTATVIGKRDSQWRMQNHNRNT